MPQPEPGTGVEVPRAGTIVTGSVERLRWGLAPAGPYSLSFENAQDVICILPAAIDARTGYDGARPASMRFEALTTAFHPGGGRVEVREAVARAGFLAFTYPADYRARAFGDDYALALPRRSRENLASPGIAGLVAYARGLMLPERQGDALAMESLAHLVFHETARALRAVAERRRPTRLGRAEHDRLLAYIEANLGEALTLDRLAAVAGLPVTTLRRRFQATTGVPLHRFVLERRLERAATLLRATELGIAAVAADCGFASQQHMTTAFRARLGITPARHRAGGG